MKSSRSQFLSMTVFFAVLVLLLGNGFTGRIFAEADIYREIEPIGSVLDEVMTSYVDEPEIDEVVEGAIKGMMNSLDPHSSYISPSDYREMTEDTQGEFDGIGVTIHLNDDNLIAVMQPSAGAPAAEAGLLPGDVIVKINDISTRGMALDEAAQLIRGPKGTTVHLTIIRNYGEPDEEIVEFDVKRGSIPLHSIVESRMLQDGIGYIRIADFKRTTADEVAERIEGMKEEGMTSFILDLRWNPGGLLPASKEVCELFLPKDSLVTYTKGRNGPRTMFDENLRLYTEKRPIVPGELPVVVLVNQHTASSAEIVTAALQYYSRAIVVGQKTYGKGSVQTIIPLARPEGSAIRLTTALYYTPAEVTINKSGIRPDVAEEMSDEDTVRLWYQLAVSAYQAPEDSDLTPAELRNQQNHGTVTGNEVNDETVEDVQLGKAVQMLKNQPTMAELLEKWHKPVEVTQREAQKQDDPTAIARPGADWKPMQKIEEPAPAGVE
jgi:carboxyl-terminal processing protease